MIDCREPVNPLPREEDLYPGLAGIEERLRRAEWQRGALVLLLLGLLGLVAIGIFGDFGAPVGWVPLQ